MKVYNTKSLLDPNVLTNASRLSMDRERTIAEQRNQIGKAISDTLNILSTNAGKLYDMNKRKQMLDPDEGKLQELKNQLAEKQSRLEMVNNQIATIEGNVSIESAKPDIDMFDVGKIPEATIAGPYMTEDEYGL